LNVNDYTIILNLLEAMIKTKALALSTILLLAGCQNYGDFFDVNGKMINPAYFSFEGDTWEISHSPKLPSSYIENALAITLRRPTRPLQNNQADLTAAAFASTHHMARIMHCKPGTSPQPIENAMAGEKWPGAVAIWLSCL
jgi:hypothetical protein